MSWIALQVEWLKSFLGTPSSNKASSRRLIELAVCWSFIFSYIKVSMATQQIADVPSGWMILILSILGLKTWDKLVDKKINEGTEKKPQK